MEGGKGRRGEGGNKGEERRGKGRGGKERKGGGVRREENGNRRNGFDLLVNGDVFLFLCSLSYISSFDSKHVFVDIIMTTFFNI